MSKYADDKITQVCKIVGGVAFNNTTSDYGILRTAVIKKLKSLGVEITWVNTRKVDARIRSIIDNREVKELISKHYN